MFRVVLLFESLLPCHALRAGVLIVVKTDARAKRVGVARPKLTIDDYSR